MPLSQTFLRNLNIPKKKCARLANSQDLHQSWAGGVCRLSCAKLSQQAGLVEGPPKPGPPIFWAKNRTL